jgi:hypothetical protein
MIQKLAHRKQIALLLLLAFVLVTRIGFAQLDRVIKWDESDYLMLGKNLFAGKGFTTAGYPEVHYPPVLPVLLGVVQQFTDNPEVASEILYIIFETLLLLPLYGLARQFYGHRIALLGGMLLAVLPSWAVSVLYWGTMSEPLYLFLIYTGLFVLWQGLETAKPRYHALGGTLFALAYLTRPEGILYFGLFAGLLLIRPWPKGRHRVLRNWLGLGIFLVAFLVISAPYIIYLHRHTGQWTFSGKVGVTFDLGGAVIERDPAAYDAATAHLDSTGHHIIWFSPERFAAQKSMARQVLTNPVAFIRRTWINIRLWESLFFRANVFPAFGFALVALALFATPWKPARTRRELFLLAALLPPFGFLILHIELRFFAPLLPILSLWLTKGALQFGDWAYGTWLNWRDQRPPKATGLSRALRLMPWVLLFLYFALMVPITIQAHQRQTDFSSRELGRWLKAHTPAQARIMSRDVGIAVYADRAWIPSPHAEYDAWLAYARYHDVDYIVVRAREAMVLRPHLAFLLDEDQALQALETVYVTKAETGKAIVYRLK